MIILYDLEIIGIDTKGFYTKKNVDYYHQFLPNETNILCKAKWRDLNNETHNKNGFVP